MCVNVGDAVGRGVCVGDRLNVSETRPVGVPVSEPVCECVPVFVGGADGVSVVVAVGRGVDVDVGSLVTVCGRVSVTVTV